MTIVQAKSTTLNESTDSKAFNAWLWKNETLVLDYTCYKLC